MNDQTSGRSVSYRAEFFNGRTWMDYMGRPAEGMDEREVSRSEENVKRCIVERWDPKGLYRWRIVRRETAWKETRTLFSSL